MRSIPLAGGLALALALVGRLAADPPPYTATVTASEAEVRSGPSLDAKFYPTNRLPKGTTVQVLREVPGGWLEIRPPEGSFSWINTRYVMQLVPTQPFNFVVEVDRAPVLIGSELNQAKPTVEGPKLARSTIVHRFQKGGRLGALISDPVEGTLMTIDPPDAEVRYIRAEALAKAPAPRAVAPAPGTPIPAAGAGSSYQPAPVLPGGSPTVPATAPADNKPTHAELDELYQKAVAAERAGNYQAAIQLYSKVAYLGLPINHQYAPLALRHADWLLVNTPAAGSPAVDSRYRPMAPDPAAAPTVHLNQPSAPGPAPAAPGTMQVGATYATSGRNGANTASALQFIGTLRKAGRDKNGQPTYVLEAEGAPRLYANPARGVDLGAYVGRNVELIGTANYDGEMRANYMLVSQVRLIQ